MKHTVLAIGPDDFLRSSQLFNDKSGAIDFHCVGSLNLSQLWQSDDQFRKHCHLHIVGYHSKLNLPPSTEGFNFFNLVGDADGSTNTLKRIEPISDLANFKRVFNHPRHVRNTGRKQLPITLAGIEQIFVPQVMSCQAKSLQDIEAVITDQSLQLPAVIRLAGHHTGKFLARIDSLEQLQKVEPWLEKEQEFLLVEYVDARDQTGLYHKTRICFVDGQYYARHYIQDEQWCIHSGTRNDFMLENPHSRQCEKAFLDGFQSQTATKYDATLRELDRRIGLDVWGMDCAILSDGRLAVFEANACMNILEQDYGPNDEFRYLEPYVQDAHRAIKEMLVNG